MKLVVTMELDLPEEPEAWGLDDGCTPDELMDAAHEQYVTADDELSDHGYEVVLGGMMLGEIENFHAEIAEG